MADNSNSMNSMLCKSNCGFFGNASCDGFCSKCYKDHVKRQNSGSAAGRVTPTTGMSTTTNNNLTAAAVAAVASAALTHANISQMNSINEIPQQTTTPSLTSEMSIDSSSLPPPAIDNNNKETATTAASQEATITNLASQMLPPPSPSQDNDNNNKTTPATKTMPIPIPTKSTSSSSSSQITPHAIGQKETISAPTSDLCSTSMTSMSPIGTTTTTTNNNNNNNNSLLASSIDSEMCNSVTSSSMSGSCSGTPGKKKLSRCVLESCKRKVGLTGFDCRCGGLYCWEHRYSDKHNCKFDYKELGQDQIRKNNPIVVGEKIKKI